MTYIVKNLNEKIGCVVSDRGMTFDEILYFAGLEKFEKVNLDDPDYIFGDEKYWYEELSVEVEY